VPLYSIGKRSRGSGVSYGPGQRRSAPRDPRRARFWVDPPLSILMRACTRRRSRRCFVLKKLVWAMNSGSERAIRRGWKCFARSFARLALVVNEPDKARGPIEQILPRGGEGQAHVTFTEFAERASGCNGYVLALDEGSGKLHRGHAGLGDVGPHVEGAGGRLEARSPRSRISSSSSRRSL
jgi:hypothetical protein